MAEVRTGPDYDNYKRLTPEETRAVLVQYCLHIGKDGPILLDIVVDWLWPDRDFRSHQQMCSCTAAALVRGGAVCRDGAWFLQRRPWELSQTFVGKAPEPVAVRDSVELTEKLEAARKKARTMGSY